MEVISPSEQMLFTTTRIETITYANTLTTGTGFIFRYKTSSGEISFIVTNKHVVAGAKSGSLTFSCSENGTLKLGNRHTVSIEEFEKIWFGHPDDDIDVAITPLAPLLQLVNQAGVQLFYRQIPYSLVPSNEFINSLDALEEIVFIGYPNGIWDHINLLPIIRKGTTATPIGIDFQGKKQFLIDAAVFPGSSGSPVFILNTGSYYEKTTGPVLGGERLFFLGIIAAVFYMEDINEIKLIPAPTINMQVAISKQMINLGVVFKASTILETIKKFLNEKGINE